MIQASAADARRWIRTTPGWPFAASGALGALAVTEVLIRSDESGSPLLISLMLGLATTAPVGLLAAYWLAPATLVSAAFVSLVVEPRLAVAGLGALVVTFYHLGRHRSGLLVAAALAPFVVLAVVELLGDSGPSEADRVVSESSRPTPFDLPRPDRGQAPDSTQPDTYPLLVAGLSVAAAGLGGLRRTRTTDAELRAKETSLADELMAHSARGERARIARELHDVVAHRISSIAVQAEAARLTTPDLSPDGARQLLAIGDSARDALDEMRRLLGVLRKDLDEAPARTPQPGIAQLPQLVAEARELSGATTRLIVSGPMAPLDPGVELTAYRIVQESLTNSRRHAPGAPVDVELAYGDHTLRVQIRDVGPGPIDASTGLGLLGMRERAAAVDGHLTVVSGQAGGFVVTATLPRVATESISVRPGVADG